MATRTQMTTTVTHSTGGVTTASSELLAKNTGRTYLLIANVSDTDVWVRWDGTDATAAAPCIKIVANTGKLEFESNAIPTAAILGIHAGSGTKNVSIVEGTKAT